MLDRPSKDRNALDIAKTAAQRGTCSRAKVGALIVRNDATVSMGYNGACRKTRECDHSPLPPSPQHEGLVIVPPFLGDMENGHCSRAVHAEANAILNAARNGASTLGSTMYVTATPCYRCAPLLIQAGVERVVFESEYRPDERAFELFREANVEVAQWRSDVGGLVIIVRRNGDFSSTASTAPTPTPVVYSERAT
jgi:dCMP deaminase